MKKILLAACIVVVLLVGAVWYLLYGSFYLSGIFVRTPSEIEDLRKYADCNIELISRETTWDDGYRTIDSYYVLDGEYRFHYIDIDRPGWNINDSKLGYGGYYFDGDTQKYPDSYIIEYFYRRNKESLDEIAQNMDGIELTSSQIKVKDAGTLYGFFEQLRNLPEMEKFYRVCYANRNVSDDTARKRSCGINLPAVNINGSFDLHRGTPPTSIFEWAAKVGITPR